MGKTVIAMITIIIMTKILGFSRDIFLSYFYGASEITDAYLIAMTIPAVFFTFIGLGIAAGYIPSYTKIEEQQGEAAAHQFTSNLVNLTIILTTVIVIVLLVFPVFFIKMFAFGFEGETLKLAVQFMQIASLSMYFTALIYIFNSFLEIQGKYLITVLAGIPLNLVMILFIYFSSFWNIYLLAIGSIVSVAIQFMFVIPAIRKTGYRYKFYFSLKEESLKKMILLSLPVIIGVSVDQINVLVDRTIASQIVEGGISALTYANRINFFIEAIFVTAIVTVVFPKIAKLAVKKEMVQLKWMIQKLITTVALLMIPATVGLMIFSEEITALLFGRGAFEENALAMTSGVLFFYSIGMLGFGLREVISKVFYSLEDSKTPMINAFGAMVLNVILNIVLSRYMGISGLALATSIAAMTSVFFLYRSLLKKIGSIETKLLVLDISKALIASLFMGIGAKSVYFALGENTASLFAGVAAGILIYGTVLIILKVNDAAYYKERLLLFRRKQLEN